MSAFALSRQVIFLLLFTAIGSAVASAQQSLAATRIARINFSPAGLSAGPIQPSSSALYPVSVAVAGRTVFAVESSGGRVLRVNAEPGAASVANTYSVAFGSQGSAPGQFNDPRGIAVDAQGNLWVADAGNNRIQKLTQQGKPLLQIGRPGQQPGQLNHPYGVAVDKSGNVYVADTANHRIQKFSGTGTAIAAWGREGSGNGQFYFPQAVALDSGENIYVADFANHRVQKLSSSGQFLMAWGKFGTQPGEFNYASGVMVDTKDRVWVSDLLNQRLQVFSTEGKLISAVTPAAPSGAATSELGFPRGVAIDSSGDVWVAHPGVHSVDKLRVPNLP